MLTCPGIVVMVHAKNCLSLTLGVPDIVSTYMHHPPGSVLSRYLADQYMQVDMICRRVNCSTNGITNIRQYYPELAQSNILRGSFGSRNHHQRCPNLAFSWWEIRL